MDARDFIKIGMSAERTLVVPAERTVGHFVPGMPMVYATPMMILEMELTSGDAIRGHLQPGWVTVGTEVDIRHLAATQRLRGLLAQHPTNRVGDVRLPTTIGTHNRRDPRLEVQRGLVREGLKPERREILQIHLP